jgi:phosphoribosylformylglycinamidine (FGAM) synthase-like amidotransferase family enzyme/selenophosphate synthetase-related protein
MINIGIIRYPGSNCDIETMRYFKFNKTNCFYIWHKEDDIAILENVHLLILPGGFAFGDRIYNKATDNYEISPGTMALNSPVAQIIHAAVKKNIPILGICNGFQILTQMGLLPGELKLNECDHFVCKKVKCYTLGYPDDLTTTDMYVANSFGNYKYSKENSKGGFICFLKYDSDGTIAGICNRKKKIFGMMPHPERNNYDFKQTLFKILLPDCYELQSQLKFDKAIKNLMFSEHISYKTTRKYLKKLHTEESWVVQGPGENAGIVDIGESKDGTKYCIAIRIESHNHPTYIDPFEGAATGVGGILRDIFTMGARPIAIMDFLRFGIDEHSSNLLEKAVDGISYYGNCVGVPNIGGDLKLHSSYNTNPLVNVAALGIVKKNNIIYGNALHEKSCLVYVGSKTGNEGINGAAMASNTFDNNIVTDELKSNVQKSDPYLEKLLLEACCEISDKQLAEGMQDMGAGGLLCATLEVIKRGREKTNSNMGCTIDLNQVPTKYEMEYSNILISESQERMLIVCSEDNIEKLSQILKKWDLEYAVIGKTTMEGKYDVFYDKKLLYSENFFAFKDVNDYTNIPNNLTKFQTKKQPRQIKNGAREKYDSTVGNRTIKGPDKPGQYSILDIYEVNKQLILTWGETFEEAHKTMRKFEGVKPLCIVNCLNFGDPKYSLCDFENTINDLKNNCSVFGIPVVGGNVSLYNTTGEGSIYPTPIIVMMGIS